MYSFGKLLKDSAVIFILTMASAAVGFLVRIQLARKLTLEDFGLFYAVLAFLTLIGLLKNLGSNSALVKFIPKYRTEGEERKVKEAINCGVLLSLATSALVSFAVLVFVDDIAFHYFHEVKAGPVLRVMMVYFVVSTLSSVFTAVFNGFKMAFILSFKGFMVNVIILFCVYYSVELYVGSMAWIYVTAEAILLIFSIAVLFKMFDYFQTKGFFSVKVTKELLGFGLPATTTPIVSKTLGRVDNIMLIYMQTLADVGVYNAVLPFARIFIIFGGSIGKVLFPYSSELFTSGEQENLRQTIARIHRLLLFVLMPIGVMLFIYAGELLTLLFGKTYAAGNIAARILIFGALVHSLTIVNVAVINGLGHPLKVTKITLYAGIFNIVCNALLIPKWSFTGASLATLGSYGVFFLASLSSLSKIAQYSFDMILLLKILVSGGVMIGFLSLVGNAVSIGNLGILLICLLAAIMFYIVVAVFLGVVKPEEFKILFQKMITAYKR